MREFIKSSIYTSIGVVAITNEKFKELIEDLIQNNHFTQDEGKRITDNFLFDLREQVDQVNGTFQTKMENLLTKLGLPTLNKFKVDMENLVNDIKENPSVLLKLTSKN